jgi:hypothetical protein
MSIQAPSRDDCELFFAEGSVSHTDVQACLGIVEHLELGGPIAVKIISRVDMYVAKEMTPTLGFSDGTNLSFVVSLKAESQ